MLEKIFTKLSKSNILFGIMAVIVFAFVIDNPDIAIMIFASLVFACSLSPIVDKLTKRYSRPVATSIVVFGSIALLAILILPILVMGISQVGAFANEIPKWEAVGHFTYKDTRVELKHFVTFTQLLDFTDY